MKKPEVYFGLPEKVKFCRKCVYSNQRPLSTNEYSHSKNSTKDPLDFDETGLCNACIQMDIFWNDIDWESREKELHKLLDKYRKNDGSYDVLVPGSGGKDSAYASHILKYKYNMNPLTITWAPHIYTNIGFENFQNWIHEGGFDNYLFTPNGHIHRKLTELSVKNLFHFFQPFIIGQKNFAPKIANKLGIDLVFYGEMPGQYGEKISVKSGRKFGDSKEAKGFVIDKRNLDFSNHYIGGVKVKDLISEHNFKPVDLLPYLPSGYTGEKLRNSIEFHYLGYYLKWIPQEAYYYSVENTGFKANPERSEGTYSKYNSLDDRIDGFHYWSTYIKFGIGRATYDASQEIRNKHLTREEGQALVKRFDGEFPKKYFMEILNYISLDEDGFYELADKFRSPHIWKKINGIWKLRHTVNLDGVDD